MELRESYDVVILGGGLAGLSLARHLLLDSDKNILLLERNAETPVERQKVGESTVQVAGYYFSRVLDLEEYLFRHHYMKYNLRFYWKTPGREPRGFEDCSQAYIRKFSNVASYQLDRNTFEAELLRRNREAGDRFTFVAPISDLRIDLAGAGGARPGGEHDGGEHDGGDHRLSFRPTGADGADRVEVAARWVVDASGRSRLLARRQELTRPSKIDHGAVFCWVDGLLDVERLTHLGRAARRQRPDRRATGHLPSWLATNHFCGDGFWFWVIPLQGKTSLGLVFDRATFPQKEVGSAEAMLDWVRRELPFFADDLDRREVLGFWGYRSFAHDCLRTLSPERWAMTGESGRFTDPLYSPGSDLIAVYNTLIVDAICTDDAELLAAKCRQYETLMRTVYEAYVPSYVLSYDVLGDREGFALKYAWELAVYFSFYVFPFVNDLLTDRRFALSFLNKFARLGPMNAAVQRLLTAYFTWKKERGLGRAAMGPPEEAGEPTWLDFLDVGPLAYAETAFYEVGLGTDESKRVLGRHLANLESMARWTAAHVASVVLGDRAVLTDRAFVESLDPKELVFDPAAWAEIWARVKGSAGDYDWGFDPAVLYEARLAGATFVPPEHMRAEPEPGVSTQPALAGAGGGS